MSPPSTRGWRSHKVVLCPFYTCLFVFVCLQTWGHFLWNFSCESCFRVYQQSKVPIPGPIENGGPVLHAEQHDWFNFLFRGLLWSADETKMPAWLKFFSFFDAMTFRASKERLSIDTKAKCKKQTNSKLTNLAPTILQTRTHKSNVWNCATHPWEIFYVKTNLQL